MTPILVDTSVWRGFFAGRPAARALGNLLAEAGAVMVHPLVIGELVLGGLSVTEEGLMQRLPYAERAPYAEVLATIRRVRLDRKGIGWVDAELVVSAMLSRAKLWSLDRSLVAVAKGLSLNFNPDASRHRDPS